MAQISVPFTVCCVLFSCSVNVMILELQIRADSSSTNLITFAQFAFIAFVTFFTAMDCGRRTPAIPIRNYVVLTTMFFGQSLANNVALSYDISMPVHMIVKSGSLVASMLLGVFVLKKRYSSAKWASVLLVTLGIIICTWASAQQKLAAKAKTAKSFDEVGISDIQKQAEWQEILKWSTGVGLVILSVFVAAAMGIYQEIIFARFGRHAQEGIFFSHALPLPGFLLFWSDIASHISTFNASSPVSFGMGSIHIPVPELWLLLLANVVTQYMCSSSVFMLVTVCDSLSVTLVITLRKFVSLFISVIWFENKFTTTHWIGTAVVILGTILYLDLPARRRNMIKPKTA